MNEYKEFVIKESVRCHKSSAHATSQWIPSTPAFKKAWKRQTHIFPKNKRTAKQQIAQRMRIPWIYNWDEHGQIESILPSLTKHHIYLEWIRKKNLWQEVKITTTITWKYKERVGNSYTEFSAWVNECLVWIIT